MTVSHQQATDAVRALAAYGVQHGLIGEDDRIYAVNRLLALLGLQRPADSAEKSCTNPDALHAVLDVLLSYAAENKLLLENTTMYRDMFDTELMGVLTPMPSAVHAQFSALYKKAPELATDWFFRFSQATNYIRTDRVARDERWMYPSPYGEMTITINLSKPELQPTTLKDYRKTDETPYPACALCAENVGYKGTERNAARANHRVIPLTLCGDAWFLQYSPYVYYNEHCIAINRTHAPMRMERDTFERLLDFVSQFPHYFMGSNADLPLVGGSVMTHEHYQGGRFVFPMETAPAVFTFSSRAFPDVSACVVHWPLSVIRLTGTDPARIAAFAAHILQVWRSYTDPSVELYASSGDIPHNTITPIARRQESQYELDLTLRNNRANATHPFGIFHPHIERHHIKKENIGVIEVMGLAILPPRLKTAMEKIKTYLLGDRNAFYQDASLAAHTDWYQTLCETPGWTPENADARLKSAVGAVFTEVLEDAGVFKANAVGQAAFRRFVDTL